MGEVTYDQPENHPMTDQPLRPQIALQINKPCPKSWGELIGDDKKRFCSECSLHVHNAAQLSEREAQDILSSASSRVCMRIEYDSNGTPVFRDSKATDVVRAPTPRPRRVGRTLTLARWALSAAAGVLAACTGSLTNSVSNDPESNPNGVEPPSKMGKVCSTTLVGDVAVPPNQNLQRLGEAVFVPAPAPTPAPVPPPVDQPQKDG